VYTEGVLQTFKEKRDILHKKKAKRIGYILRRNCDLKHVIEGLIEIMIEVMGRQTGRNQLLDNLKKTRRYWNLK
jgi:hypothetical protein